MAANGGPPPAEPPMVSDEDEDEAFVATEEGDIEGEVIYDLDEDDMQGAPADESDGEGGDEAAMEVPDASAFRLEEHTAEVMAVAAHPSEPLLFASGACDDSARLWRAGGEARELAGHSDTVCQVAFNASGELLATGGVDGRVIVWQTESGAQYRMLEGPGDELAWVAWHPRGDVLLAGSADFTAWMWNAGSGACMQVFSGHNGAVSCGGFTPDGRGVVTGGADAALRVWSARTGECTHTVQGHPFHEAGLTCLAVSGDSALALSGAEDGSLRLTSLGSGKAVGTLEGHEDCIEAAAFAAQLPGAALSAGLDGRLIVWDAAAAAVRLECAHPEGVVGLATHPSAPLVATGCLDGVVRVWDMRTGRALHAFTGHTAGVQCVAWACDGRQLVSGADDNTVRLFKL